MKHYAIRRKDGGVSIMAIYLEGATVESELEKFSPEVRDEIVSHVEINVDDIPADRTFRAAWTCSDGGKVVTVDMKGAREIHRNMLRRLRAPKLAALDIAFQRALEDGDESERAKVMAAKKVLRDALADPSIDAATTPGELMAAIPDVLKPA